MKCIICHGEDIQVTAISEALKIGDDVVYVPIQIPICHTCGERYYDRRTVQFLEQLESKLKDGTAAHLREVGKVLLYG